MLRAPMLSRQGSLTSGFHVEDEELAGVVTGRAKEFRLRIRAKRTDVTKIPPIEFTYFDPRQERFVTVTSDPIPLKVRESTSLTASDFVDGSYVANARTRLAVVDSGLLANSNDVEALLSRQPLYPGWGTLVFATSGPLLCVTCLLIRRRHDRVLVDPGYSRRRSARKTAIARIRNATADGEERPAAACIAAAVTGYVADRCNHPPHSLTRSRAVSELRLRGVPETSIDEVDELLAECEPRQYGAAEDANTDELIRRACVCINQLDRRKFRAE